MSDGAYVLLVCLLGMLFLPVLTAAFNSKDKVQGRDISSHRSSVSATKTVNLAVLVALLLRAATHSFSVICWADFIYAALVINAAAFISWNFFAMTDTSMHVHILTEFYRARDLSKAELLDRYSKNTIVKARIKRLLTLDQLRLRDGKLTIAGRTVLAGAEMCKVFRRVLGIPVRPPV
jgi:hypothetical protein